MAGNQRLMLRHIKDLRAVVRRAVQLKRADSDAWRVRAFGISRKIARDTGCFIYLYSFRAIFFPLLPEPAKQRVYTSLGN